MAGTSFVVFRSLSKKRDGVEKEEEEKKTLELGHQPTNGGSTNLHLVLNSLIDNARLTYSSLQFGLCKRGRLKPW